MTSLVCNESPWQAYVNCIWLIASRITSWHLRAGAMKDGAREKSTQQPLILKWGGRGETVASQAARPRHYPPSLSSTIPPSLHFHFMGWWSDSICPRHVRWRCWWPPIQYASLIIPDPTLYLSVYIIMDLHLKRMSRWVWTMWNVNHRCHCRWS